jgi:hypothetical protein
MSSGLYEWTRSWRPWFAWRPVKLEDGRIAWLERVQKQPRWIGDGEHGMPSNNYRAI